MTDNEIIKAIEICAKNSVTRHNGLTYQGMPLRFLFEEILGFVNRQKAEIERLQTEKDNLIRTYAECQAEAVKEFAERLKESKIDIDVSFGYGREHYTEAVAVVEIDNLVKEFTEGKND